ncbi:MAG: methyl-accepting chemotaxis protein, partial [Magnetococcales bacterium]|nr:methyl-accepting chemotaxis protein [Magnetococcales bacterium]
MLGVTLLIAFLGWEGRQSVVSLQETENRILKMQSLLSEMEKNVSLSHILADAAYGQQVHAARGALSTALSEELRRTSQPEAFYRIQHLLKLEKEFYNSYLQLASSTTSHAPASALQPLILISGEMHHELTTLLNEHQERQREITLEVDSWLIGGMLLAMILAGVAIILTMISFKRSVRSGILFIEDVEKGKLNTRVEYKSGDELGILLGSLQKMGEALLYAEQQHLRTHMSRIALSAMMETSMEPLTLNEQLT